MMIVQQNVHKIVKYRFVYYPSSFERMSKWACRSVNDFKNVMRTLPPSVLVVNARIHETQDYIASYSSSYPLVDAWDWVRLGYFPVADKAILERAAKYPDKYRQTKNGIWIRRLDVVQI